MIPQDYGKWTELYPSTKHSGESQREHIPGHFIPKKPIYYKHLTYGDSSGFRMSPSLEKLVDGALQADRRKRNADAKAMIS